MKAFTHAYSTLTDGSCHLHYQDTLCLLEKATSEKDDVDAMV